MEEDQLLVNKIACPDGTILESRGRHDFQHHILEDGRSYALDGGLFYRRIWCSDEDYVDLSCYVSDPIEKIREHFTWKSVLDENEDLLVEPVFRLLKDLTDVHIDALIKFTAKHNYPDYIVELFEREKLYRSTKVQHIGNN